jgi:HSP20 family protein
MPRQSLPQTKPDAREAAFFPPFENEINRLVDQFRSGFSSANEYAHSIFSGPVFPAIDVVETKDAIEISAEVPGIKKDDLDATISGKTLILKGEKSSGHEQNQDNYHLIEGRYGSFRHQVPLGFIPDAGAIDANFADGFLKLRIAKPTTAKAKVQKINIQKF